MQVPEPLPSVEHWHAAPVFCGEHGGFLGLCCALSELARLLELNSALAFLWRMLTTPHLELGPESCHHSCRTLGGMLAQCCNRERFSLRVRANGIR